MQVKILIALNLTFWRHFYNQILSLLVILNQTSGNFSINWRFSKLWRWLPIDDVSGDVIDTQGNHKKIYWWFWGRTRWFVPHLWTDFREQSTRCRCVPSDVVQLWSEQNTENLTNYIFKGTFLRANNNIEFVPFCTAVNVKF